MNDEMKNAYRCKACGAIIVPSIDNPFAYDECPVCGAARELDYEENEEDWQELRNAVNNGAMIWTDNGRNA